MSRLQCPEFYAERARAEMAAGDYTNAAASWGLAATASSGHKRRARYHDAQESCERKAAGGDA